MNEQDPLKQAISALEKAEKRHEKIRNALDFIRYGSFSRKYKDSNDGQSMSDAGNNLSAARHEVTEALVKLRALQSQPTTDGLGKVREALEYSNTLIKFCVKPEKCVTRGDILGGKDKMKSALAIYADNMEALAILDQKPAPPVTAPIEMVVGLAEALERWEMWQPSPSAKMKFEDYNLYVKSARLQLQRQGD